MIIYSRMNERDHTVEPNWLLSQIKHDEISPLLRVPKTLGEKMLLAIPNWRFLWICLPDYTGDHQKRLELKHVTSFQLISGFRTEVCRTSASLGKK